MEATTQFGTITWLTSSPGCSWRTRLSSTRQRHLRAPLPEPVRAAARRVLSSSTVNVLWGFLNLVVGYLLVCRVGTFSLRRTPHVVALGVGILAISVMAARGFGRFHGGL